MLSSANLLYRYRKFVALVLHYPRFKAKLVQYLFEIELTHLKQICECFCHADLLDQLPRFKISSRDKPFTLALEVEAALVACAVNKFVSIPAEPKMTLTQPYTVEF